MAAETAAVKFVTDAAEVDSVADDVFEVSEFVDAIFCLIYLVCFCIGCNYRKSSRNIVAMAVVGS